MFKCQEAVFVMFEFSELLCPQWKNTAEYPACIVTLIKHQMEILLDAHNTILN